MALRFSTCIQAFDGVTYLHCIYSFQRIKIFQDDLDRQMRGPHGDGLHGAPMVRCAWVRRLNAGSKEVFYSTENEGCMINRIDLYAE